MNQSFTLSSNLVNVLLTNVNLNNTLYRKEDELEMIVTRIIMRLWTYLVSILNLPRIELKDSNSYYVIKLNTKNIDVLIEKGTITPFGKERPCFKQRLFSHYVQVRN